MNRVKAFQTTDNQVHLTELAALNHQHTIDLRGFFNRVGRKDNLSVTEVIGLIQSNHLEFTAILANHAKKVDKAIKKNSSVVTVPV